MEFSLANLLLFLMIGIIFFCFAVIAMVILFGISAADLLKKPREMVLLLTAFAALPVLAAGTASQTRIFTSAASQIRITGYRITDRSVTFTTDRPALAWLEYKQPQLGIYLPVLPEYSLTFRTLHSLPLPSPAPASIWLVINGVRLQEIRN